MLKLTNITKTFSGLPEPTLKNINLHLAPGDFCVLLGNNGSGKSTLMRVLSGEHTVDAGTIQISGVAMTQQDRSAVIASVVQDVNAGTIGHLTLLENCVLSMRRGKAPQCAFYSKYAAQVIAQVAALGIGLERYLHTSMSSLSGGQRQMLATLMAINSRPQLLLLDEHTSALDPRMQQILMEYTARAVVEEGITTLMITHKLEDALNYGNRLMMLRQGEIVCDVAGDEKKAMTAVQLLELFHADMR